MREIKTGDKYLCNTHNWNNYIKGNIYVVENIKNNSVCFINEKQILHYIDFEDLKTDFKDLQEVNEIKVNYEVVPSHYDNKQGYDVIDISKHYNLNFNRGNIVKYICRAGKKDNELQDLKKALDYLQREIKHIENN
jgi:hypothetical protein